MSRKMSAGQTLQKMVGHKAAGLEPLATQGFVSIPLFPFWQFGQNGQMSEMSEMSGRVDGQTGHLLNVRDD
ncbi:MAG: hypothetical protein ABJN78_01895 [Hyphomicrobiales bacterium]